MKLYVSPSLWLTEYSISKGKIDSSQTKIYSICTFQKSLKRQRQLWPIKKITISGLISEFKAVFRICMSVAEEEPLNNTARLDSNASPQMSMEVCSAHSMLHGKDNIQKSYYCRPLGSELIQIINAFSNSMLLSLTLVKV